MSDAIALVDRLREDFERRQGETDDSIEELEAALDEQAKVNKNVEASFHKLDLALLEARSSVDQKIDKVAHSVDLVLERLPEKKSDPTMIEWIGALQWPITVVVALAVFFIWVMAGKSPGEAAKDSGLIP